MPHSREFAFGELRNAPDIKPGSNYDAWRLPVLTPEQFRAMETDIQHAYLISLAHLAPSTHNTQPWAFHCDPQSNTIGVFLDKARVLPWSDVVGRQASISIGCALASLDVGASYLGLNSQLIIPEIDSSSVKPDLRYPNIDLSSRFVQLASLQLSHSEGSPIAIDPSLFKAIFTRSVDRGEYDPARPIDPVLLDFINNLGKKDGINHIFFTNRSMLDRGKKGALADLQGFADNYVANNDKFARELGDWLVENDTKSGVGMPGDTFKLGDGLTVHLKQEFMGLARKEAMDIAALANAGKNGIKSAFCVGMLTVDKDDPLHWIKAGIALGKGALIFEQNGISWSIHAGLAEVKEINIGMLRPIFGNTTKRPVILFRAGYPKEAKKPHSPRLPLSDILL